MRTLALLPVLTLSFAALAQEAPQPATTGEGDRNRRVYAKEEIELPLPITSPRAVQPGVIEPLSPREKAARALRNTIGLRALGNRVILAGINHWMDEPEEWGHGWDAYGQRFASRMGRLAVRNAIELSADVALKTDSRYDRCACTGFFPRTAHAWRRVLVTRTDSGGETIAINRLAGAYITPMITDQWYPSRLNTWGHKLDSGSQFLMWRGATNMIREFWPQISGKLPVGKDMYK